MKNKFLRFSVREEIKEMSSMLRPGRIFMLAGVFLLLSLNAFAQNSRPRLVNPKVDEVAGMVIVRPDPTNRGREVNHKRRKTVLPKSKVKIVKTPAKTKSKAPTKTKKKEGNLKPMATAKKPAAKKAAPKKAAAKPAAKKAAPKAAAKPAAKKTAPKAAAKPAAKKAAPKKAAAKPAAKKAAPKAAAKPAAKKAAPKKAAAKKPAAKKPAAKKSK
jgi:hypothetical protein